MSQPVELIPMMCINCKNPLTVGIDEVAWVCETCGHGQILSDEEGLKPLTVYFDARIPQGGIGKPFWVVQGQASLQRSTYSGDQTYDMLNFWSQPHLFFVPAFDLPLEQIVAMGAQFLRQPPEVKQGSATKFMPVTLLPEDVRPLAEFILIGIEADRKDMIKELHFDLKLSQPALWVLP